MSPIESVTFFDAHVHVYRTARVERLLDAAAANFHYAARSVGATRWRGALLLTETASDDWFEAVAGAREPRPYGRWVVAADPADPLSLLAREDGLSLQIIAGRQIVSAERIEVHALGTREHIPDGLSTAATVQRVHECGALAALPWGAGKWTGRRRRIAAEMFAGGSSILVSDNGGRPWWWPEPLLGDVRRAGRPVLRGSDALPIPGQEVRVGSFGCWFRGSSETSARAFIDRVGTLVATDVHGYGTNESLWRFARNQVALHLGRASKRK